MEIVLKSRFIRYSLVIVELLVCLSAISWIMKSAVAQWEAETNDVEHLTIALRLDPTDADYHLQLGRLYEYFPSSLRPRDAMKEFHRAAELDPFDPSAWINLAAAFEFEGKIADAETNLRRADYLAPRLTDYQWPIGNFFLLHGNINNSFPHLRMVLAGTRKYDQTLFETAWKASGDPKTILDQLIPENLSAEFSYLNYLYVRQRFPEAHAVWERIRTARQSFDPQWVGPYMDTLIGARRPAEAFAVWTDLQGKGLLPNAGGNSKENLVYDGDFETGLPQLGFGWRVVPVKGVVAGLDTLSFHSPNHALLVQFSGQENLDYRQVFQYVEVDPDRSYHLRAFMKTEKITTESGPRIEVRDIYDPASLDQFSDSLTGTSGGWVEVDMDFRTGRKTELIVMSISRLPSEKLDNLISGSVWLDDVRLVRLED